MKSITQYAQFITSQKKVPHDTMETSEVKVREAMRTVEADGWYLASTKGDHRQYKHHSKPGRVTIPGHLNDDLAPKTRDSIFRQAGIPLPRK